MNKKRGKGLFHRIIGGLSAIALAITSFVPLTENLTAEAAVGQYYTSKVGTKYTTNPSSGSGMDAVYNITLSGNGENLNVFCIGYGKSIPSNTYIERAPNNTPITNKDLQKALGAVVYYGYASHKNTAYYIATQADLEIIRKHYLAYGQKLAPRYIQDKNLTYFIDPKTGKGTNDWKPYFNPQNPPNASMTCQEPLLIAYGYNGLGDGKILEQINYKDNDIRRIISQGLNYYNWKTADSSWELAWYIQFGYINGGKELNFLCISDAR